MNEKSGERVDWEGPRGGAAPFHVCALSSEIVVLDLSLGRDGEVVLKCFVIQNKSHLGT